MNAVHQQQETRVVYQVPRLEQLPTWQLSTGVSLPIGLNLLPEDQVNE